MADFGLVQTLLTDRCLKSAYAFCSTDCSTPLHSFLCVNPSQSFFTNSTGSARSQWVLPDLAPDPRHSQTQPQQQAPDPNSKRQCAPPGLNNYSVNTCAPPALPDLKSKHRIAVGTPGPQRQAPDRSGRKRRLTATWALPNPQKQAHHGSGRYWISSNLQTAVSTINSKRRIAARAPGTRLQCKRRASTASARLVGASTVSTRSQRAFLDLNCKLLPGSLQAPDRSGRSQTYILYFEHIPGLMPEHASKHCIYLYARHCSASGPAFFQIEMTQGLLRLKYRIVVLTI